MDQAYKQPQTGSYSVDQTLELVNSFMRRVYNWMALGLGLSAVSAYVVSNTTAIYYFINEQTGAPTMAYWVVLIATFGLAIGISAGIRRLQVSTAAALFIVYGTLMGVFLAPVLMLYTQASVFKTFLITAGTFGITSIWASTTKKDLSGWGSFLFMGLIGIILASLVNLFIGSTALQFAVSVIGVLVFAGLTAYDTQQIKEMYSAQDDGTVAGKKAVMGALRLYLDFINLFMMLLQLFGQNRN